MKFSEWFLLVGNRNLVTTTLCLSGPFVHPHTCSPAFCHSCFIAFHLLSASSVSITSFLVYAASWAYSRLTLGSLSFHTFILGMCILFFFLIAPLMTSPTNNWWCDTPVYSSASWNMCLPQCIPSHHRTLVVVHHMHFSPRSYIHRDLPSYRSILVLTLCGQHLSKQIWLSF